MKLSVVLVGVNVAATLSVAAQQSAIAQDKPTGTAEFLKSALVETAAAPKPISLTATAKSLSSSNATKVSMSDPRSVNTRKALQSHGVKLRPFVANRKLPTKAELQNSLSMETAVMDYGNQAPVLDGGVTEYSPYYISNESEMSPRAKYAVKQQQRRADSAHLRNAAKVASSYTRQTAPRAVPGASPAVPGSVGYPCADQSFSMPVMHQQPMMQQPMQAMQQMQPMQQMQQMPRPQMQTFAPLQQQAQPVLPLQAPHLSPQEQLEMNKLVDNACIQNGINPNVVGPGASDLYARIGAPPFPLSLVPEPVMKDFLRGARTKKSAIAGSNMAMGSGGGTLGGGGGHLPAGGFRSYLTTTTNGFSGNFQRIPTAVPISKHQTTPHSKGHHAAKKSTGSGHQISQAAEQPKNQVLTYPPYRSQVNFGS